MIWKESWWGRRVLNSLDICAFIWGVGGMADAETKKGGCFEDYHTWSTVPDFVRNHFPTQKTWPRNLTWSLKVVVSSIGITFFKAMFRLHGSLRRKCMTPKTCDLNSSQIPSGTSKTKQETSCKKNCCLRKTIVHPKAMSVFNPHQNHL